MSTGAKLLTCVDVAQRSKALLLCLLQSIRSQNWKPVSCKLHGEAGVVVGVVVEDNSWNSDCTAIITTKCSMKDSKIYRSAL